MNIKAVESLPIPEVCVNEATCYECVGVLDPEASLIIFEFYLPVLRGGRSVSLP